jgi:hypothetical protein
LQGRRGLNSSSLLRLNPDLISRFRSGLIPDKLPEPPAPTIKNVQFQTAQRLNAYYPLANRDNRPIYTRVSGSGLSSDIDADWLATPHGMVKETGVPNQLYVLPDEYGLHYDVAQGRSALNVLLIDDNQVGYRVRLRLTLLPDLDSRRTDALREWLRGEPMVIPYAELLVGGHQQATFQPTGVFRDLGLSFVEQDDSGVDARGFELVFDCTLEMYQLLATMLVEDAQELRLGEVVFQLRHDGSASDLSSYAVPVWMRLQRPAIDPLQVERVAAAEDGVPRAVNVINLAPVALTATMQPTLLAIDAAMPAPIGAELGKPQRIELAPQATATFPVEPLQPTGEEVWGAVAVSFWDVALDLDAAAVLARANELASSTRFTTILRLWSTPLRRVELLPPALADVYGIEVQVRRGSGEPLSVTLETEAPDKKIEVAFSLADLMAELHLGQPTVDIRRRNLSFSGTGEWSEWQTSSGRELHVVPVGL